MIWTALALVLMVALAGFIAYYGDLMGRRWGKKRISWFGLRPKYTAVLITSLTGCFIAIISIATVLLAFPPVRDVVTNGERAIRENKELNNRLKASAREYATLLNQNRTQLDEQYAKLDRANKSYHKLEAALTRLQTDYNAAATRNVSLQKEIQFRSRQLAAAQVKLNKLRLTERRLKGRNHELTAQNKNAEIVNKEYGDRNVKLEREIARMEKYSLKLQNTTNELLSGNRELLSQQSQLRQENSALTRDNEARATAYDLLDEKVKTLQAKQDELLQVQRELYGLAMSGRNTAETYEALRRNPIILDAGELIARRSIPAHLPTYQVRSELHRLLDEASELALRRGAALGSNGKAIRIPTKRIVTPSGEQEADEDASLAALTENLSASDVPVVVTVTAQLNSLSGEQALVELSGRAVLPIFKRGAVIASRIISANQPVERIADSLLLFLQQDVRDSAIRAGTIPQIDPETGAKHIGTLQPNELASLTGKMVRMGGDVLVTAIARDTSTSAGPVRLTFRLTRPLKRP